jgi:hypothetical protein
MGIIAKAFYKYGLWSARKPITSIFIGLIFIMIGSIGFINSQTTVRFTSNF